MNTLLERFAEFIADEVNFLVERNAPELRFVDGEQDGSELLAIDGNERLSSHICIIGAFKRLALWSQKNWAGSEGTAQFNNTANKMWIREKVPSGS